MEFLCKLGKKELKDIIETIIDKLEETNVELAEDCVEMIEEYIYEITVEDAKELVANMKPCGEVFNWNVVTDTLKRHNAYNEAEKDKVTEYYLTMNMIYNDYKQVIEKYNVPNSNQFCYDMCKCFIEDEDCGKYKVSKYFLMMKK